MSSVQNFTVPLVGGALARELSIAGRFLLILNISDGGAIDLTLRRGGASVLTAKGVYSSFKVPNIEFDTILVESAAARTVQFATGTAEIDYSIVSGTVTVAGVVETRDGGTAYGGVFSAAGAVAANALDTIVAPAANLNGVLIHASSQFSWDVGSNAEVTLLAKTSAPANWIDGDVLDLPISVVQVAGYFYTVRRLPEPLRVPVGKGVYMFNARAQSTCLRNCVYTVL